MEDDPSRWETLHETLNDPDARPEAIEIIRSLIDRIILVPAESGFEVELVGEIDNMVELAIGAETQNKTAASGEAGYANTDGWRLCH